LGKCNRTNTQEGKTVSRKKTSEIEPDKMTEPGVRAKVFVRADMIGAGKIQLLQKVDEAGSISGAAKSMGLGYRRAWFLIDTVQRSFAEPIIVTTRGGTDAGAELTDFGRDLVERFTAFDAKVQAEAADLLGWVKEHQAKAPPPDETP
jgi:molybdate transport system regulatory protein